MNWWFLLIVGGLATHRITCLVSRDLGPWRMFARLRSLSPRWLGCIYCFSVTAAVMVCAGFYFSGFEAPWPIWIIFVLAFSGIAIIVDRTWTSDHNPK